jgi:hypothetical protein
MRTLIAASLLLAACAAPPQGQLGSPASPAHAAQEGPTQPGQRDLEVLASFFTGNWDSVPADPPVRLRVAEFWSPSPVRWFYLEWTRRGESTPTRQLAMRVAEDGYQKMTATLHRIPDAARHTGEWRQAKPFAELRPADLPEMPECRLKVLRTLTAHFILATEGVRCPGDLPSVPYMRFEFSLASSELELLEQPRNAAGNVPAKSRLDPFQFARMAREPS